MSVPHVLLRLLLEGPAHGYDLRRKLSAFSAFYPLSNVNVYPALKDLEERSWVCSRTALGYTPGEPTVAIRSGRVAGPEGK